MIVIDSPNPRSPSRRSLGTRIRLAAYAVAAFVASACAAVAMAGPAQADGAFGNTNTATYTDTLYGVYTAGANVECYRDSYSTDTTTGNLTSSVSWVAQGPVGYGWAGDQVFSAAGAIFLRTSGKLYRYEHLDPSGCTGSWTNGGLGTDVTPLTFTADMQYPYWLVKSMFGEPGSDAMYAIRDDGSLIKYTYNCGSIAFDPTTCWSAEDTGGTGWDQMRNVVSTGDGVIYGIDANGNLKWYHYLGNGNWAPNSGAVIANWSNCTQVAAGESGSLYCVAARSVLHPDNSNGLYWYYHTGSQTGAPTWAQGSGQQVGWGWDGFSTVFGFSPRAPQPPG